MVSAPRRRRPMMPDTPQRRELEQQRGIREIVFGVQDGILTTLGIVTGVGAAGPARSTILLTGLISLVVGAISMAAGEYLGGKSEREVVENAIALERAEMADHPEEEFAEQVAYYRLKGFTPDESTMIVQRLVKNPDIWLHEMVRDEFGIDPREAEDAGLRATLFMGGSFAAGAFIPLLAYIFPLSHLLSQIASLVLAAIALFIIGYIAGGLGGRRPLAKALEIVGAGALVFVISYIVGTFVPPLFGMHPVSVGG